MSTTRKRIVTLLMALVMLMSVFPMSAFTGREEAANDKSVAEDVGAAAVAGADAGASAEGDDPYTVGGDT